MTETTLDRAHAAMAAAPEDGAARLRFYAQVADSDLVLLLAEETDGEDLSPEIFDLEEGRFILAFDTEERLAEFAAAPVPYAALPGRVIARMLAGQGVGLGLNLGVAPSALLLPAEALVWLAEMLDHAPRRAEARPVAVGAPRGLPAPVAAVLDATLAGLGGLARAAHLVAVDYDGGRSGHLLAFEGATQRDEAALAKAVSEALVFSGVEAGEIDVAFLAGDDPLRDRIAAVSRRFVLPEPAREKVRAGAPAAPGMDPARPPKLR